MKTRWKLVLILALLACVAAAIVVFHPRLYPDVEWLIPPNIPSGPSTGYVGQTLTYTIGGASSSLGFSVQYYVDWGDGNHSESDLVDSGSSITASHTWHISGLYCIRARVVSTGSGVSSNWSHCREVTISEADSN
jgi:hypothetical protein